MFWKTSWESWQDGVIGRGLWSCLLGEGNFARKEGFAGSHEGVSEGLKVGSIAEFLGENVSAVDVARNMFDLDGKALLLSFADKVFSEVEMFDSFGCCFFGPVVACVVVVVDDGG